jgi:predicted amidophosphoribosyltransferase
MKTVFRICSSTVEYHGTFADLEMNCSAGLLGHAICNVLRAAFPRSNAVVQNGHGFAAFSGETKIRMFGQMPSEHDLVGFLDLLGRCLTVCDTADVSHCLDVYRIPDDEIPPDDWRYTPIGQLVYDAKYSRRMSAAHEVGKQMALVVARHPALLRADAVASMPSSGRYYDAPSGWKAGLVRQFGLETVNITRTRTVRVQKKINDRQERVDNQKDSMACADTDGKAVIVLDDLYMDGATMDEAVRAIRAAGASEVFALCGVKTARGTQGGVASRLIVDAGTGNAN